MDSRLIIYIVRITLQVEVWIINALHLYLSRSNLLTTFIPVLKSLTTFFLSALSQLNFSYFLFTMLIIFSLYDLPTSNS